MANPNEFLAQLKNFDKDHLPLKVWKKLRDQYMCDPDFTEEALRNISTVCAGLFCWIQAIYIYSGLVLGQDVKIEQKERPTTSPTKKKRSAKPK